MSATQPLRRLNRQRAVLYLRQSVHREESISLELQEAAGRQYCERQGYDVVAVEADPGISGRTWKRPAVQRVMGMIEAGDADVVVLWRWSRLSRSRRDWALAIDRCDVAGGKIESATEPIDTSTASGRFARGLMTEYSAFQSEQIGEQWRETHARRRRLGLPAEGGERFGYVKQPDGSYAIDPVEGPLLAQMYRRYLAGDGFTRIVGWLNGEGHVTKAGAAWSRVPVTALLDAGFGAGMIVHRPTSKDGKRSRGIAASTFHAGAHEAVISEDEWEQYVERRLQAPLPSRVIGAKYMLTGMIFCGDCGASMHVGNQGLKDYKCSRAAQYRDVPGMYMTRSLVEQAVREWVAEQAGDVDELARIVAAQQKRTVVQLDNVVTLDRRIAELKERLGRITVRWSAGNMPDSAYDAAVKQLDADLASLNRRRREAAPQARVQVDPSKLLIRLDSYWDGMTVDERRKVLAALVSRVEIAKPARQGTGVWRDRVRITAAWDAS